MESSSLAGGVLHSLSARKCHSALDAARTLLRHGEAVNAEYNGTTPLHIAAQNDNLEMAQMLLHFGADPTLLDKFGRTSLDVATGKTKEFLLRMLALPQKKRKGILYRIFICHTRSLFSGLMKKARKNIRRITSATHLRPTSISDPPLPKDRHDPHPPTMIFEDDPLPLEKFVLPGTPLTSRTPPVPSSDCVTTKRGGRPRARVIPASATNQISAKRVRAHSVDDNLLEMNKALSHKASKSSRTPRQVQTPNNNHQVQKVHFKTPRTTKPQGGLTWTPSRNVNTTPRALKLPTPKAKPSAPPMEPVNVSSDAYFTADDSILDELEARIRQIKINDPAAARITKLTDHQLRAQLAIAGISAGPITPETRKGYEKKLILSHGHTTVNSKYSGPLQFALDGKPSEDGDKLDHILRRELDDGARQFNYILLDPRAVDDKEVTLDSFIAAIFYVGKGTGERPLSHLIDAKVAREAKTRPGEKKKIHSDKIERINLIWSSGVGVIQLEIGKGVGDRLALTREGCMMLAIGSNNLTNKRGGEFHGAARTWDNRKRAIYGTYLILRAHKVFNADRPQQIMPRNVPDQLFGAAKKK
ncbi:unnamed protein product, partial [Mesorhabditis belari]|uniref:LEM domain-containing protein n=1 Tax=Mesorhabditis belari TaxID=2138241 RepID=A0AAF3F646_9BILA